MLWRVVSEHEIASTKDCADGMVAGLADLWLGVVGEGQ